MTVIIQGFNLQTSELEKQYDMCGFERLLIPENESVIHILNDMQIDWVVIGIYDYKGKLSQHQINTIRYCKEHNIDYFIV